MKLYDRQVASKLARDETMDVVDLERIVQSDFDHHLIIVGHPGAGKTSSIKYICQKLICQESKVFPNHSIPILVRLRNINSKYHLGLRNLDESQNLILNHLANELGFINRDNNLENDEQLRPHSELSRALIDFLEDRSPIILIDGFDEISQRTVRMKLLEDLRSLAVTFKTTRMLLTSRTGELRIHIDKMSFYEICPFSDIQIKEFSEKWLGKEKCEKFLYDLTSSPYRETAVRPLTLAHLCANYDRTGRISSKPYQIYKKVTNLLIEKWDEDRQVIRKSVYEDFEAPRKFEFLCHLSFVLTTSSQKTNFDRRDLENNYFKIHEDFGLPRNESLKVAQELEEYSGIFLNSGAGTYEFSHKCLQEYLCAEHIVKLPAMISDNRTFHKLGEEMAVATVLSSDSSLFFFTVVSKCASISDARGQLFSNSFISRLLSELPDFNNNPSVGWGLLVLYSLHVKRFYQNTSQRELFVIEPMLEEIRKLASMVAERISRADIEANYKIVDRENSVTGSEILILNKTKRNRVIQYTDTSGSQKLVIPNELFVNEDFLIKD